ncbi:MAG: lysophospholipid acyltransferase family protein [Myxococcota bacterium]
MRHAYSLLFWFFLATSCVLLSVAGFLVFLLTFPFDRNGRIQHLYSCVWAQLYFHVNPLWRLRVEGRERLPWHGAAVLVSNHQSLGDILVLFGLYRPFKWVSKKSVFSVPFIGWNMRLNRYVALERGNKESIGRMMAECRRWLDRGVPVLLFPEGTRSPDGEVKAFKDGAFRLAMDKGCPVIPIVLTGTGRTLPKHGFVLRDRANCLVKVLEPVDPAPFGGDLTAFREAVRSRIVEEKAHLDLLCASSLS